GDRAVHLRARTSTVVPGEKRHVPSERVERALRLTLQAVDHRALVGLHSPQELALDSGDLIVLLARDEEPNVLRRSLVVVRRRKRRRATARRAHAHDDITALTDEIG